MDWLGNFIKAIIYPFEEMASAVMGTIVSAFTKLFLIVNESGAITGVSPFGMFVGLGLGISLVLGLTKFVTSLVRKKI